MCQGKTPRLKTRHFRTGDLAKAASVHVNTVRLYEDWGLLPPIPRSHGGHRLYTEAHLTQLHLARAALDGALVGRIKKAAFAMVQQAAKGDFGGALERSYVILALAQAERAQAEVAASFLERWASGAITERLPHPLKVREVAELLNVSNDVLRNWERNGLIQVPRHSGSRYRLYGATEVSRLRVIRVLRDAGYSTMAILRMVRQLDGDKTANVRQALDTPSPQEDVFSATDRWLSSLEMQEERLLKIIEQLEETAQR